MSHEPVCRLKYEGTALPTGATTEKLWDSTDNGVKRWLHSGGVRRFAYVIENDQDGTVNGYFSTDDGTTWTSFYSVAATAAAAPNSGDVFIEPYDDVKFEWVNGGVTQTTFIPNLVLSSDRSPSA